ncbi:MAG: hypothetical protein JSV79_08300 [Armatimonadota bacterium]|nr:MAG: hypothetical protein JSV79_08300 [Armatimonadota bacterium]
MRTTSFVTYQAGRRGSVFLLAIVILVVILTLGASLIEKAQTALYRTSVENRSAKTFHLAEAGIHRALWEMNQPNGWLTYPGESALQLPAGFVDVTVTPAPSSRGVFTDRLTMIATGYLPGPDGTQRYPCKIRMITYKEPRYFAYAAFGEQQVIVGNGSVTVMADSYTSDDGPYGGGNTGAKADIGTNSTAADAIVVLPQGEIHGDVHVGAGASPPELCVDNNGTITGTIEALDAPNLLPGIPSVPAGVTELGDIWLDHNDELILDEGTYHMTDLDMFGSSQITCNGKVVIYIDVTTDQPSPDVRIGGNGIVNTSQIPSNLVIYCLDDVPSVDISGNAAFYGGIYAPNGDITLNSGEVYGSLVGKTVNLNGATATLHYDEALRDHSNPHAVMRSWEIL